MSQFANVDEPLDSVWEEFVTDPQPQLDPLDVESFATLAYEEIRATNWLVRDYLATPGLVVFFGEPGCKKSFVVADLCVCLAMGKLWIPPAPLTNQGSFTTRLCKRSRVLWLDDDNGRELTVRRFQQLALAHKFDDSELLDNLHIRCFDDTGIDLSTGPGQRRLVATIQKYRYDVVVIDNYKAFTEAAKENDNDEQGRVGKELQGIARRNDVLLGVIHHSTKSTEQIRGASAIKGAASFAYHVKSDGNDPNRVVIEPHKIRGVPYPARIEAKLHTTQGYNERNESSTQSAIFYSDKVSSEEGIESTAGYRLLIKATVEWLYQHQGEPDVPQLPVTQTTLLEAVRKYSAQFPGAKVPTEKALREPLDTMRKNGQINWKKGKSTTIWHAHEMYGWPDDEASGRY